MNQFIVITGATGNLGGRIIRRILDNTSYDIAAILLDFEDKDAFLGRYSGDEQERLKVIFKSDIETSDLRNAFAVLHLAFARRNHTYAEIADSIDYCKKIFTYFAKQDPQRVIYISSQGIYGNTEEFRREDTVPAPETVYSMAKYAGEKVFEMAFEGTDIETCVVRLESVAQSQNLIRALCKAAIQDKRLVIQGGEQTFSYIDEEDAADAISLLTTHEGETTGIYNIGPNRKRITLMQVAEIIRELCGERGFKVDIEVKDGAKMLWAGMDSSKFMNEFHWSPAIDYRMIIEKILSDMLQG